MGSAGWTSRSRVCYTPGMEIIEQVKIEDWSKKVVCTNCHSKVKIVATDLRQSRTSHGGVPYLEFDCLACDGVSMVTSKSSWPKGVIEIAKENYRQTQEVYERLRRRPITMVEPTLGRAGSSAEIYVGSQRYGWIEVDGRGVTFQPDDSYDPEGF